MHTGEVIRQRLTQHFDGQWFKSRTLNDALRWAQQDMDREGRFESQRVIRRARSEVPLHKRMFWA